MGVPGVGIEVVVLVGEGREAMEEKGRRDWM